MFWDLRGPRGCRVKLTWGGGHLLCLDQGPVWSSLPPTPECPRSSSDTTFSQLTPQPRVPATLK